MTSVADGPGSGSLDRRTVALAGHSGDVDTARAGLVAADAAVRATALGALQRLDALTATELRAALDDPSPDVRRRAATIAAHHGDVSLLAALDDEPMVAEAACWACGEREAVDDEHLRRLIDLAAAAAHDDADRAATVLLVREAAIAALGALGDDRGLDAILGAISPENAKPPIRRRATLALAPFLDPDHPRYTEVIAALDTALTDRDWQVRQAAEDISP